jgi:hypothetical protein
MSLWRVLFDNYRPERHYMRGPGPKWRAKHGAERVTRAFLVPAKVAKLCSFSQSSSQNLGVAGPPSADAIARRVRYATDTMLRAWSTASPVDGKAGAERS